VQQAANKFEGAQFANSPDLANGILNAIMDVFRAHSTMSHAKGHSAETVSSGFLRLSRNPERP
jgi:hypothetical protein